MAFQGRHSRDCVRLCSMFLKKIERKEGGVQLPSAILTCRSSVALVITGSRRLASDQSDSCRIPAIRSKK